MIEAIFVNSHSLRFGNKLSYIDLPLLVKLGSAKGLDGFENSEKPSGSPVRIVRGKCVTLSLVET